MKNLYEFMSTYIDEGRRPGSKNKSQEKIDKLEDYSNVKIGKDVEKSNTQGKFAIDEPTDDEILAPLDKSKMTNNTKALLAKFMAEEEFFILGKAGWGKTSIIKKMAKRFGRTIITVYLDKAVATDLDGIPVPVQLPGGGVEQETALPKWAAYMLKNPKKKFLLFFDEMNQAQPDVQQALMPIVLDHKICNIQFDNFFVGAAGNFESENIAINELQGPLKSRFKPIITWETNTPETWKASFEYMRKEWAGKETESLIDLLEENQDMFDNPREVEHKIIKNAVKTKENGTDEDKALLEPEIFVKRLEDLCKSDLKASQRDQIPVIADAIMSFILDKGTSKKSRSRANEQMIPPSIVDFITSGIKNGYFVQEDEKTGEMRKYGCSRENIFNIEDLQDINREQLERLINKLETDGVKFKHEKDSEWKKLGWEDPNAE